MIRSTRNLIGALLIGATVLALPACSTVKAAYDAVTTPVDMTSIRKTALSADLSYATTLDLAVTYANLPACGTPTAPPLCADKDIVNEIVRLSDIAQPLVDAMNKTVQSTDDASIAQAAVAAATNAIEALKKVLPSPVLK